MNINEVLKLADDLLFSHTEKHLTPLQKSILEGILQDEDYFKIAEKNYVTQGHVQDIASELWQILSQFLGQKIRKKNVRSILDKLVISSHFAFDNFQGFKNINIFSNQNPASLPVTESNDNSCCLDLDNAPKITNFYGRINELNTLKNWLEQSTHLISLYGITGIGKTSLALKLTEEVKNDFQYIIYRSFCFSPCFSNFLNDILSTLIPSFHITDTINQKVSQLMKFLRKNPCLIILDDIESLFECKQFAGNVKDFLACQSLFLSDEIIFQLRKIWQRLTEVEQEIIKYLSQQNNGVTLMQIFQEISANYSSEIKINGIQSLKRRCLLDDNSNDCPSNLLQLNPIYSASLYGIYSHIPHF